MNNVEFNLVSWMIKMINLLNNIQYYYQNEYNALSWTSHMHHLYFEKLANALSKAFIL